MILACSAVLGNYQPATPGRAQRSQAISQNPQSAARQRLSRITMDRDASSRIQNGQRANPFFLESCSDPRLLAASGQSDVSIAEHWPPTQPWSWASETCPMISPTDQPSQVGI